MKNEQPGTPKPRARRTSPEAVRRRMLDVAKHEIAQSGGLTLGFEHLPMEGYIKEAEVPRSSVYRIWNSQASFVADLIQDMFDGGDYTQGFAPATRHAIEAVMRDNLSLVHGTAEQRRALVHEMVRVGVAANLATAAVSEFRRSYWTLASAIPSIAPGLARDAAVATVTRVEASFLTAMASFYETLIGLIGLRLRDPFTPRHIAVLTNSIVDSFTHRFELDRDVVETVFMASGLDGEPVEWTYAAWTIASAIDGMTSGYDDAPGSPSA